MEVVVSVSMFGFWRTSSGELVGVQHLVVAVVADQPGAPMHGSLMHVDYFFLYHIAP